MTAPVEPAALAAIPIEHRHTIALWLLQRAKQYQPSFVCPETTASALQAALSGAAVDLYMPEAEDSTVGHAAAVVAELTGPAQIVHLILDGKATTECCARTPFELRYSEGHRITNSRDAATCGQLPRCICNTPPPTVDKPKNGTASRPPGWSCPRHGIVI